MIFLNHLICSQIPNSWFQRLSQIPSFRFGRDTEHAIIALIQYIHECLDSGETPATIY